MIKLARKIGRKLKRSDNKSFVLVVTHGRSGSTLMQGILNRAPDWHIHGENANMLYLHYKEVLAAQKIKWHQKRGPYIPPETGPWFGYKTLDVQETRRRVADRMRSFLTDHSPSDAKVIGFKEVRYFDVFLEDPKILRNYLDFLRVALKPCKFIMLTRDPNATSNSAWWADQKGSEVVSNMQAFGHFLTDYANNHPENAIHVTYADVVNQTDRFWDMLSFVGAEIDESQVAEALSLPHSYKTKSIKPFAVPKLSGETNQQPHLASANAEWAKGNSTAAQSLYQSYHDAVECVEGRRVLPDYVFRRLGIKRWHAMTLETPKIAVFDIPGSGAASFAVRMFAPRQLDSSMSEDQQGNVNVPMSTDSIEHLKDHFKFAVVREPVKRFVSCFYDRVLRRGDLKPLAEARIVLRVPDINQFAMQLDYFADQCLSIEQHILPQSRFLNGDLTFADKVYPAEDLKQVAQDVARLVGHEVDVPRQQVEELDVGLGDLSEEAFEHILKYYAEDYALLKDFYSEEAIRAEYEAAREAKAREQASD